MTATHGSPISLLQDPTPFDNSVTVRPPRYQYHRLEASNTIRLLNLRPWKDPLQQHHLECTLEVVSLADNPSFEALSYTWGALVLPEILVCNNDSGIGITKNLYDALVSFRLPDSSRKLWVDAVCIDQTNDSEKSLQIPLMPQIYGQATEVLIWLGEAVEGSKDVVQYLNRIGQAFVDRGGEIREPRNEPASSAIWDDVARDPNLEKLHLVLDRPWFTRRWVIQETALARKATVHHAGVSMDWDVLWHASRALARLRGDGSRFWNRTTGRPIRMNSSSLLRILELDEQRKDCWIWRDQWEANEAGGHMLDCIDRARAFECSVDKDRIFALLGIFNRGRATPFEVDYEKSVAEVYEAFARYCLRHGDTVDILAWAGETNRSSMPEPLDIPSWVPDWRLPVRSSSDTLSMFRAGHRLSSNVEVDDASRTLVAQGMMVDRVVVRLPHMGAYDTASQVRDWYAVVEVYLRRRLGITENDGTKYRTGEDIWQALARTLVAGKEDVIFDWSRDSLRAPADEPRTLLYHAFPTWRQKVLSSSIRSSVPTVEEDAPQAQLRFETYEHLEYEDGVIEVSKQRAFFVTSQGFIGLGPKGMELGDVICVLNGSSTPSIVRPLREGFRMVGEGGVAPVPIRRPGYVLMPSGDMKPYIVRTEQETYRLIGECYAHGLMYGEVWDLDGLCMEDFAIV